MRAIIKYILEALWMKLQTTIPFTSIFSTTNRLKALQYNNCSETLQLTQNLLFLATENGGFIIQTFHHIQYTWLARYIDIWVY